MFKKLLSLAVAALIMGAVPAAAQCAGCKKAETENCCAKAQKENDKCCGKCGDAMFKGLNLTAEQKAALKQLKADCKKEAKEAKIAKLKTILTPEQFAQVEKNMQNKQCCKKDGKKHGHDKKHGHGKKN